MGREREREVTLLRGSQVACLVSKIWSKYLRARFGGSPFLVQKYFFLDCFQIGKDPRFEAVAADRGTMSASSAHVFKPFYTVSMSPRIPWPLLRRMCVLMDQSEMEI